MKIAIISDIHEDLVNLQKALTIIEKNKCDEIYFLGDLVGFAGLFYDYGDTKNANECIRLIRTNCTLAIAGNHDLYIAKRFPEFFKKNNYPTNWYELSYQERRDISKNKIWLYEEEDDPILTQENMEFMKKIPQYKVMEIDNKKYLFSHYYEPDISGVSKFFPTKKADFSQHFDFMSKNNCQVSFTAHGHVQGYKIILPKKISIKNFGKKKLKNTSQIINCPAIATNEYKDSGFVIFDTINFEITVLQL